MPEKNALAEHYGGNIFISQSFVNKNFQFFKTLV